MKKPIFNDGLTGKRRAKDIFRVCSTLLFSCLTILLLVFIVVYIFQNGSKTLSWDFLTSDYNEVKTTYHMPDDFDIRDENIPDYKFENNSDDVYKSENRGISFKNGENHEGKKVVYIAEILPDSYFNKLYDQDNNYLVDAAGEYLMSINAYGNDGTYYSFGARDDAKVIAEALDNSYKIDFAIISTVGGGIRGSLLTTIYLILMTLLIALPIGVGGAIYLSLFAHKNKVTNFIRTLIDMTSAIPSIIFGLLGALIFIPFCNAVNGSDGGSIMSGALTLAVMLIPTIVKTTEEAIIALPAGYLNSSLALGASRTETVFKVILPNAVPGIITSITLSIGRIIGESAALVFAVGNSISDNISLNQPSSSLAVHIYALLNIENPNYDAACAISIIILGIVFVLSIITKIISYRFDKKYKRG